MTETITRPRTAPGSPSRVARTPAPRWLDTRLVLGVLLVVLSVVVGARVFAGSQRLSAVYVARHPLVAGEHVTGDDLAIARLRFHGEAGSYIAAAGAPPVGYVVTRYVGPGELVPAAALSASPAVVAATRLVTVPVAPGHLSADLARGDLVDVYLTAKSAAAGSVKPPTRVLAAVPVESVDASSGIGAATVSVVLAVPAARTADAVHAVESGALDIVRLPASAADVASPAP